MSFRRVVLAFMVSFAPLSARAQPEANPCQGIEQSLEEARRQLESSRNDLKGARETAQGRLQELDQLRSVLARAEKNHSEAISQLETCRGAQSQLCTDIGNFVRGVGVGKVQTGGLGECVAAGDRRLLVEQLSGWTNATSTLSQFGAFAAGESDLAPRLGPGSGSRIEKLVARLFATGNGSPLVYRRLLVEATRLAAPRSWEKIRKEPGQVERWFQGSEPLDASFSEEAQGQAALSAKDPLAPPPLATALELVGAYQILAGCRGPRPARECGRALELRKMLETSGPVVARRRVQDVWAQPCAALDEKTIAGWMTDPLPSASFDPDVESIAEAAHAKLFTCFLRDSALGPSLSAWMDEVLGDSLSTKTEVAERVGRKQESWKDGSPDDLCVRAARALQGMGVPRACADVGSLVEDVEPWVGASERLRGESFTRGVCDGFVRALWSGHTPTLSDSFSAPPTVGDAVRLLEDAPSSNMSRLRELCGDRVGSAVGFPQAVSELARIGMRLGEDGRQRPWGYDSESGRVLEDVRASRVHGAGVLWKAWKSLAEPELACNLLELDAARCASCRTDAPDLRYDCAKLQEIESHLTAYKRRVLVLASSVVLLVLLVIWGVRLRRNMRKHASWLREVEAHAARLGLEVDSPRLRYLFPSRWNHLSIRLPIDPAWSRWGSRALLLRSEHAVLSDRDVDLAGRLAQRRGSALALLVHDDGVSPDLGAVRAILDWAARGGSKAVHVLPLSASRLSWTHVATDLLELAEESSLRSNPFEVRGRVTTSSQFFNRERLVSGLLASARAGQFTVVTGLRRFGKSSLALEVARRLPGPSAYVDLAGFHHEIRTIEPSKAVDAILRFLCLELIDSLQGRSSEKLELAVPETELDAATLRAWFRDFLEAAEKSAGDRPPPMLLILDEIEQAIGAAAELDRALEVFAILVGRLRNALPGSTPGGHERIGVLFASALHPLLWSPLGSLAHQSLIGSFQHVSVPRLPREAALHMMQGLGARQGIRFRDEALELLVRETQGVPLLARRLGSAVLELYDTERAHQGVLGALEIGVEGVRAAIEREVSEGSPLRVWVESEIADPNSPGGVILRALARTDVLGSIELKRLAAEAYLREFEATGISLRLPASEALRRAQEAGDVTLRILGDSGLLEAHGDPTEPEAYELPAGVIRVILSSAAVDPMAAG